MSELKLIDKGDAPLVVMRPKAWETSFVTISYLIFFSLAVYSQQIVWILFFGAAGFFSILYQFRHFNIDENGITYRSFLRMKYVAWSEIVSVGYTKRQPNIGGWFHIDGLDSNPVSFAKNLSIPFVLFTHVPEFAQIVLTKVDHELIVQSAREKLTEFATPEKRNVKSRN